jgi:ligand-binding sensor domain-containing protein/serine phosphatase RsbU (regulator of sigma subunit)
MKMKLLKTITLLIMTGSFGVSGQDYFFRQYTNEDGLYHSFIYAINQDIDGFLWLGTGEGLYRFNGFDFEYFTTEEGLADNFVTDIFRDTAGKLWIGHQSGSVSVLSGKDFTVLNKGSENQGSVTDITQDEQGFIWATVQNQGLLLINENFIITHVNFAIEHEPLSRIAYLDNNQFLIGSQENIYLGKYEKASGSMLIMNRLENYPGSKVVEILPESPGNYLIVSQEDGIYRFQFDSLSLEYEFSTLDDNGDGILDNLQGGILDEKGILWLESLGNGLIKYRRGKGTDFTRAGIVSTANGLVSDNVRSVFEDLEGNLWFGMYGEGLLRYVDNNLTFFSYHPENESNSTYAITGDDGGLKAVIGDRLLSITQTGDSVVDSYPLPGKQAGDRVNTAYMAPDGRLWLGLEQSGLYFSGSDFRFRHVFISDDDLANSINHITGMDGYIWVSTKKGICRISGDSGHRIWFTTDNGLPHNNIHQLYIDSRDRVLIATMCSEIHYIGEKEEVDRLENSSIGQFNSVVSISESKDGTIWAGTLGNGAWKIGEESNINYSRTSGLLSDFCYSITHTEEGMVLTGHRGGISQIDPEAGKIKTFSRLEGVKSSAEFYPNANYTDDHGHIWFGTSEGPVRYNSAQSAGNKMPPRLHINALYVDGEEVDASEGMIILRPGYYELAVDYIGINFSNPEMVIYQTKLEGYNKNWSDRTYGRRVVYDRVGYGDYAFKIRAYNENDIGSEISSAFELKIKKPIYLAAWFYAGIIILLGFSVFLLIKRRERKQKQLQILLQHKLDERTHEVITQKEKIEIINKDITDSINYAQKIQASILPPVGKLKERFNGAFVFFQPKDIVSGDFYWFGEFDNDVFIIACADATGHGVPGAFMSMIGTTLIKDICSRESVDTPSKILSHLDKEVMTVLSQNLEDGGSNDGMDIRIAEINLKSCILSTASAMRPMVIYRGGEAIYVTGNRVSIGGQYDGSIEKTFDTENYSLKKGDKLYMFTDGYSDQFGGPQGKKFKTGNIKNLLHDINEKPMDEQYHHIRHTFESWKKDFDQVDDVLFMGIEI